MGAGMMEIIIAVILGIVASMVGHDVSSNIKSICRWLIRHAARQVPLSKRARLQEEWMADIDATAGAILKLFVTLGFFVAAFKLRRGSDWALKPVSSDENSVLGHIREKDETVTESTEEPQSEEISRIDYYPALLVKVNDLGLSIRSSNCLRNDNIVYVGDLVQKTEGEMLRSPNFGRKSLNEVREVLAEKGLHLGMEIPNWPPENIEELCRKHNILR